MRDEGDDVKATARTPKAPVVKTAEEWATAKGMLPAVFSGQDLRVPAGTTGRAVRVSFADTGKHAPRANPKHVAYAAAKAFHGWIEGVELTEAEFDVAVARAYGPTSEVICR